MPSIAAAGFYCCFIDVLLCFNSGHNFIWEEDKLQDQKIQGKIKQYPWELLLIKIELLTIKQQSNLGKANVDTAEVSNVKIKRERLKGLREGKKL